MFPAERPAKADSDQDGFLVCLSHTQQQKGDRRDDGLTANGAFMGADRTGDLERLLDPAREQLEAPTLTKETGGLISARTKIVQQRT
jgi:hypothetical protein